MLFRQCSIGGKMYKGHDDALDKIETTTTLAVPPGTLTKESTSFSSDRLPSAESGADTLPGFRDASLSADITAACSDGNGSAASERLVRFFTTLALCHTALISANADAPVPRYSSQSPDETALVLAAAEVGFVFRGRERTTCLLRTPVSGDALERYELLHVLEFNSARKRMSVLVRREGAHEGVLLLTKGAESVIFDRIAPGQDELRGITDEHLADFANEGLRTLTLAYKPISGECMCGRAA